MRIIISPAKKMNVDVDSLPFEQLPRFLPQTELIKNKLQSMSFDELQKLWLCNVSIAKLGFERLHSINLQKNLTPAILAYEGIQYKYMAPGVFKTEEFEFIAEHLQILSAFYGVLNPFDGVVPYRLEMQAKLAIGDSANLYQFWGDKIAKSIEYETNFILNLASKEYSKMVLPHLSKNTGLITCTFGQDIGEGKLVEKGALCKMARGEMVRFLAENNITKPEQIKQFNRLGYKFNSDFSDKNNYIFVQEIKQPPQYTVE